MCKGSVIWLCGGALALLALSSMRLAYPQGMATGSAVPKPARPLPEGMKLPAVEYVDIAKQAGLTGVNVSGATESKQYIVEATGTGVAIFDFDNDGLQDILLVNGGTLDAQAPKPPHYLYRNLGGLRFEDVTANSGIRNTGWGQGVCAGDFDNDGNTDILITHWGQNVLYRNDGKGRFRDVTQEAGLPLKKRWSTGCSFLDYDRDGDLDVFVANYVDFDPATTPRPGDKAQCTWKNLPVMCGPRGLPAESMSLFRNDKGRFVDASEQAGIAGGRHYYGFTAVTSDFDNDGWPDIYVACDSTASLLYRNKQDGTFEEIGIISGTAYNEDGREQAGMGATVADYDRDGLPDIFKTNFSDDTPTLYRNAGDGAFTDNTVAAGLAVNTKFLGWGTAFLDVDHDGWKDIFQVNGHVYPEVDSAGIGERFRQERVLYWNRRDGQFHDMSASAGPAVTALHSSRGIAVGDLDNDGSLEIVVVNMHETPSLLRNRRPGSNAVLVQALTREGRAAVGARVTLEAGGGTQTDEVRSGGYHISQGDFRLHFGLGTDSGGDITVRWPGGRTEQAGRVEANTWVVVQEGKGIVERRKLKGEGEGGQKTAALRRFRLRPGKVTLR